MSLSSSSVDRDLATEFFGPVVNADTHVWLILLNFDLPCFILELWQRASLRVCADGGANQWFDAIPKVCQAEFTDSAHLLRSKLLPDVIRGDLDSLRNDVREFYEAKGVRVDDLSADQDTTDLMKSVNYVEAKLHERGQQDDVVIVVAGALGGRLDHTLSNLHTLHRFPHLPLVLLGEGNLARLVPPGTSRIRIDPRVEGPQCALVPLNGSVMGTSKGLKWELEGTQLDFQGLISTSNQLKGEEVLVEVDGPVVWMTQLREGDALQLMQQ